MYMNVTKKNKRRIEIESNARGQMNKEKKKLDKTSLDTSRRIRYESLRTSLDKL